MKKYRLLTRADLDGIMSATLLKKFGMIDEIKFCHPKDMQDGKIEVTDNDIITNLPYNENAHFVFDHHFSEDVRAYGHLTADEIKNPKGWLLLNYILDPRTGLGRYDSRFRLKNFDFMKHVIDILQ